MNAIMKQALKMFAPQIEPGLIQGEKELKKYLDSIILEEGETKARVLVDYDQHGNAVLVICTFKGREVSRMVASYRKEKLIELIGKIS